MSTSDGKGSGIIPAFQEENIAGAFLPELRMVMESLTSFTQMMIGSTLRVSMQAGTRRQVPTSSLLGTSMKVKKKRIH